MHKKSTRVYINCLALSLQLTFLFMFGNVNCEQSLTRNFTENPFRIKRSIVKDHPQVLRKEEDFSDAEISTSIQSQMRDETEVVELHPGPYPKEEMQEEHNSRVVSSSLEMKDDVYPDERTPDRQPEAKIGDKAVDNSEIQDHIPDEEISDKAPDSAEIPDKASDAEDPNKQLDEEMSNAKMSKKPKINGNPNGPRSIILRQPYQPFIGQPSVSAETEMSSHYQQEWPPPNVKPYYQKNYPFGGPYIYRGPVRTKMPNVPQRDEELFEPTLSYDYFTHKQTFTRPQGDTKTNQATNYQGSKMVVYDYMSFYDEDKGSTPGTKKESNEYDYYEDLISGHINKPTVSTEVVTTPVFKDTNVKIGAGVGSVGLDIKYKSEPKTQQTSEPNLRRTGNLIKFRPDMIYIPKPVPKMLKCYLLRSRDKPMLFSKNLHLHEIQRQLDIWAKNRPIVQIKDITNGNLTVMLNEVRLNIIDKQSYMRSNDKITVVIVAGLEGNDHQTVHAAIYILKQLIEHPEENVELLQKFRFIILPNLNPDGYDYSVRLPNRVDWVKNLNQHWNMTRECYDFGLDCDENPCYGVNLDRNFLYQWIPSVNPDDDKPCGNNYAGERRLSEVETNALSEYLSNLNDSANYYFFVFKEGPNLGIMYPHAHTKVKRASDKIYRERAEAGAKAAADVAGRTYVAGQTSEFLRLSVTVRPKATDEKLTGVQDRSDFSLPVGQAHHNRLRTDLVFATVRESLPPGALYAGGVEDWAEGYLGVDNAYSITVFKPEDYADDSMNAKETLPEAFAAIKAIVPLEVKPSPKPKPKPGRSAKITLPPSWCLLATRFLLHLLDLN